MLRSQPNSVTTFCAALAILFSIISISKAAPLDCPDELSKFSPRDGELFVGSQKNPLQRIREGHDSPKKLTNLKPDKNISVYYFAAPQSLITPMVFAFIRGYKIKPNTPTSLNSSDVFVSNSASTELRVAKKKYSDFHDEKRFGPNILRTSFHMNFEDALFSRYNSYDDVTSPKVYALPEGRSFNGYKARMQRISGFPEDGRCVVFTLFEREDFAEAVDSFSAVFVELAEKSDIPSDAFSFAIDFHAPQ